MKKIPIKATPNNADDALIAAALSKQNTGQYKEAIELYKQLLKQADNKVWRQALAQCYLQRALSFAEKGMVKEAVVLWENYAQNAEPPHQGYDCYIGWLFQTNNIAKVKTCLNRLSVQQLDEHYLDLAALLGLLIITEKPELEAMLPKDSAFIGHLGWVRAALTAYRDNKPEELEQALKRLPFRSAFRDFRTLLKAALELPESLEQAQSLLAKIPAASPYHQAGQLLLATTHNGSLLVNDLLQCEPKQRQIVGAVKKFTKKQFELLELLVKQKDHFSDKIKFNCAIQYRELFGLDLAQAYCRAMLMTYSPGQRDFNKHFGGTDEFEQCRLKALTSERDRDYESAEYYWKQGITLLKKQGPSAAFKIALIMRHVAAHKQTPRGTMQWLVDSLDHDPGDRDSYLKILQYYEHQTQQADDYKQWLDKAIKAFPNDIDMLVLVIKAALANKAFKKATQYAKAILKIDPVNTFAKQVLFTSHLAHARKLIKTKKFHLVEKEIQQAEKLNIGKRYQTQAQLMRGFLVLTSEDKKQGLQQIADVAQKMNDGALCAYFCVIMETLLMGLTLSPILKGLTPSAKNYQLSEQELVRLVQLVQQYHGNDKGNQAVLHKALEKIKAIIKESLKQQKCSEETLLTLCQCLDGIGHFELLRHCAKIAWSRWIKPIWVFYKIYAEANGQAGQCSDFDIMELKYQLEESREQSDERTAMLIVKFVEQYYKAQDPFGGGFFDDYDDDEFDEEDASSIDLFAHLPEELFNKIQKKMDDIMKRNSPDRVINMINKLTSKKIDVNFILTSPDTFWGLLALHAASELGIDTGVSADEVLSFAQYDAGSKPSSFPFF